MPFTVYFENLEFDEEEADVKIGPNAYSYEKPYLGDESGSASVFKEQKTGLIGQFLGQAVPSYLKLSADDKKTLEVFVPAMKAAGLSRCLMSYDGGNDEGFGTLVYCADANGKTVELDSILENEAFLKAIEPFIAEARDAARKSPFYRKENERPTSEWVRDYLTYEIPVLTVSLLLGRGYGTGEYELYGRAVLDLDAMTITDDPDAPYPHGPSV